MSSTGGSYYMMYFYEVDCLLCGTLLKRDWFTRCSWSTCSTSLPLAVKTAIYLLCLEFDPFAARVRFGGNLQLKLTLRRMCHGRGTPYDFNGELDQSFCLVSDKDVHVNMRLEGYFDNRTAGATILKNGKALRTWAK